MSAACVRCDGTGIESEDEKVVVECPWCWGSGDDPNALDYSEIRYDQCPKCDSTPRDECCYPGGYPVEVES